MSDPYITAGAWTATFTATDDEVSAGGINPILAGVLAGDAIVDPSGMMLAIIAVGATTVTLAQPAPTSGTVQFRVAPVSSQRTTLASNSLIVREVYAKQQAAAEDNRSIPVISLATAPPGSPADGDRHLVIATATGDFAGKEGYVAQYDSANTRWIFIAPIAGMKVTVDGSAVIRVYTGSAWAIAPPISSATTVGRLARFTDTAGGLGQSQMSEDGSGNVTVAGTVSASGSGIGFVRIVPGDAGRSGYLAFYNAAGIRQGFMGDVAGGLISLYAEAGNAWSVTGALTVSGNISGAGTIAAPGLISITGAPGLNGYATLKHGDATGTGYLEFQHKDGTRRGYIGYASGGYINMVAEGGYGWNMSGNFLLGGDLSVLRSNSGGAVGADITNSATGASAASRLRLLTGTANSSITIQINDNTGTPFILEQSGSAVTAGVYKYHHLHVWGSQAGAEWARLSAAAFASSVPVKPPSYTVATVPSAATAGAGALIYVTDETGGATGAQSDGTNWRRFSDRAVIS